MRKLNSAAAVLFLLLGIIAIPSGNLGYASDALVDEFHVGVINKIEGNKVTITLFKEKNSNKFLQSGDGKSLKGEPVTFTVVDQVKIARASFDTTAKKIKKANVIVGDALPGGLKNDIFARGDARVRIAADRDNKVSEILVFETPK